MAAADALPVPIKNTAFRLYFEVRKNDGTLITTWTGQDSEVSLDGAAYADCTNEATEIGTSGTGYIDLTSTEMNADFVFYKLTVTNTDALVTVIPIVTTVGGEIPADPTGIRAALGLATANLDTQLTAIDTVVDSVLVDTAVIGALGAGLTAIPWNASWDAEVQSEVADALTVYDPPTNAELDSGLAALNDLSAAEMRTALGLGSANLDTQLADLPTNAELATALASADDAVLAALATVDSNVDSILVDTVDIQAKTDQLQFTGGVGVEKVNSYDADANADLATLLSRTAGGVTVVSQSTTPTGTTRIGKGKRYTGSDRLTYTSDTQRDLSTNTLVALQFNGKSFTADSITGSAGAWTILVPLTNVETDALFLGTFDGELSVYDTSPNPDQEIPELAKFKVTVYANV